MKYLLRSTLILCLLAATRLAGAADFDVASTIPVFNEGRVKPLQSFGREAADAVYDRRSKVRLSLEGYFEIEDRAAWERVKDSKDFEGDEWKYIVQEQLAKDPEYAGILDLFPEGKPNAFGPTEIVLSWLIEPE